MGSTSSRLGGHAADEQYGIAVNDAPPFVHEDRAVSIAVECHTKRETLFDNERRQALRMRGAALEIDVAAIRFVPDGRNVESELAENAWRHARGRAVRTIETDARTTQAPCVGDDRLEMLDVPIHEALAGDRVRLAFRHGPRRICHDRFDVALEVIGELFAGAREHLDAVVFEGIV